MKFDYEYRTSDNVRHEGVVVASNRDDAFDRLKAQGIRPSRLVESRGFFNKLFGKGKRWLVIVALVGLAGFLALALFREEQSSRYAADIRSQLFGDPSVIQNLSRNGWRETFPDPGEAWLARHAIPGRVCSCAETGGGRTEIAHALVVRKDKPLAVNESDPEELQKMKRIVNGMKREFSAYYELPSDADAYMQKACERLRIENGVRESLEREITSLARQWKEEGANRADVLSAWEKKNATLRSMGLQAIPQPE